MELTAKCPFLAAWFRTKTRETDGKPMSLPAGRGTMGLLARRQFRFADERLLGRAGTSDLGCHPWWVNQLQWEDPKLWESLGPTVGFTPWIYKHLDPIPHKRLPTVYGCPLPQLAAAPTSKCFRSQKSMFRCDDGCDLMVAHVSADMNRLWIMFCLY